MVIPLRPRHLRRFLGNFRIVSHFKKNQLKLKLQVQNDELQLVQQPQRIVVWEIVGMEGMIDAEENQYC